MGLEKQPIEASNDPSVSVRVDPAGPEKVRVLIVSEDEAIAKQLKVTFSEAGFISEHANSITAGCDSARSGRFQVVVSTPIFADGSWKRLVDIATHYDRAFVVVLVASTFGFQEWTEALEYGAFDVLDALHDLPMAADSAKRAAWAAYLKGARSRPKMTIPPRAA